MYRMLSLHHSRPVTV